MSDASLPPVLIGERILWLGSGSGLPKGGKVKWIGRLPEMGPQWAVGLELDEALPYGGIDGTWGKRKLFKCQHKHGLIVPHSSVIPQPKHKTGDIYKDAFGRNSRCSSKNGSQEYLAPPKNESKVGKFLRALSNDESSSRDRNEDLELPSTHLRNPNLERQLAILGTLRRSKLHDSGRLEGVKSEACLYSVILEKEEHVFRERQRMIHGRFKRSDDRLDRTSSIHSSRSGGSRRDRSSGIFSIFRWFKKEKSEDSEGESPPLPSSPVLRRANGSVTGSIDTLFSTATTRSFAFVPPSHYRPYGGANPPEIRICPGPETNTYRNRIRQRDLLREAEKNISLREKYRLYASETLPRSVDRINEISEALNTTSPLGSRNSTLRRRKRPAPPPPAERNDSASEKSLPATLTNELKNENDPGRQHRRTLSEPSPTRYVKPCHVKGKRRAPPPPESTPQPGPSDRTLSLQRKKRRAPPPPIQRSPSDEITDIFRRAVEDTTGSETSLNHLETASTASTVDISQADIVATDTLKLERGYLKPAKDEKPMDVRYTPTSPVSPRPWYKRNAASRENSFTRSSDRKKEREKRRIEDWMIESGIPRKPNHLPENRFNIFAKMDKTEEKRRSQISILTNISELDREAAEIVKKNKEKEQALLSNQNNKFYEEIGATSNGYFNTHNDPTHNVISLYNSISNVTVNSGFFLKDGDFRKENTQNSNHHDKIHRTVVDEQVIRIVDEPKAIVTEPEAEPEPEPGPSGLSRIAKVTIEELDDFDKERNSKAQAIFEANRQQRHQSPFIPTIAEASESAVASPASTVANTPSDPTLPPLPGPSSSTELKPLQIPASIPASVLKPVVHVVWNCPRCTLENPRWKITCEACDMWRPVPCDFKEVTPKHPLPLAVLRVVEPKDNPNMNDDKIGLLKQNEFTTKPTMSNGTGSAKQSPERNGMNLDLKDRKMKRSSQGLTISDLLFNTQGNVTPKENTKYKDILNGLDITPNLSKAETNNFQGKPDHHDKPLNTSKVPKSNQPTPSASGSSISSLSSTNSDKPNELQRSPKRDIVEPEEIRRARLVFFEKFGRPLMQTNKLGGGESTLQEFNKLESAEEKKVEIPSKQEVKPNQDSAKTSLLAFNLMSNSVVPSTVSTQLTSENKRVELVQKLDEKYNDKQEAVRDWIAKAQQPPAGWGCVPANKPAESQIQSSPKVKAKNPAQRDENTAKDSQTLTDIPYKPTLSHDQEEDRKKLREMLIEMKHSLPKRPKEGKLKQNNTKEKLIENSTTNDLKSVDAVSKSPESEKKLGAIRKIPTKPVDTNYKHSLSDKAEAYLVESETIIEEIKMRKPTEKVSSAAQTNAVVKQITPQPKPPTGKEVIVPITVEEYTIKDGVLYTSVKKSAKKIGTGTFQLMRPRDFANIEAIKTKKLDTEVPLYANVASAGGDNDYENINGSSTKEVEKLSMELTEPQGLAHFRAGLASNNDTTHLNTIAVNRLLRRLESAIANGQHELAAALARELAQLQVNCVVTRQKPETATSLIQVDMFVEDKENHQGPFPLRLKPSTTVEQLKLKVEREYEIPCDVQRWIIGKSLASDDKAALESLGVTGSGAAIFLYLVAPENLGQQVDKDAKEREGAIGGVDAQPVTVLVDEIVITTQPERPPRRHHREEIELTIEEVITPNKKNVGSSDMDTKKQMPAGTEEKPLKAEWRCNRCTLVNSEARPGCAACGSEQPKQAETSGEKPVDIAILEQLEEAQGAAAKKVEEDKKRDYQKLVDLEKSDLIVCSETFECPICMVDYEPNEGVVLRECLHVFCRACLANTVEYSDEAEVKCPFRDDKYTCDSTLLEREIKALVTPEVYEQHLAKSIALAETKIGNAFHCKTPDCKGWCIFEDNVNLFRCPVCSQTNCLTCQAIHAGVDCKQFQEQLNKDSEINVEAKRTKEMLQEMVDRGEAMNCPTCQVVLMKKWGCDWLRCSMCKTEICWITRGPRWGPNGKGDTSGGCQCGVNGVKCHPKCTYCH